MDRCGLCKYRDRCDDADCINFCDDCKDSKDCTIRTVSCKAGYDIECNNGFEYKEAWEDEEDEE